MKVLVCDVCGTLYDSNTTFDFLDYYFKDNKKYIFYRKLTKTFPIKLITYPFYKYLKYDIVRYAMTQFLKNENYLMVDKKAEEFVYNILSSKIKREIIKILEEYRNKNYKIILMSGSYDFIVKHVSNYFDTDAFFASQLEEKNETYTGFYAFDNLHSKKDVLKNNYAVIDELIVISDNLTDLELFLIANKSFAICNKSKQIKYWKNKKIDNMELVKCTN
jgi:HAD superfamily phosphoserine phosphatase-like hydrolase